jgi:Mce-associated membrane protein
VTEGKKEDATLVDESTAVELTETTAAAPMVKDSGPAEDSAAAEASEPAEDIEAAEETAAAAAAAKPERRIAWARVFAFGILPALALVLALAAGFLKFQDSAVRDSNTARVESVQAAKDSTIALLSYKPDTVEKQLNDARDRLTGGFRDQYTSLINDVVIPGAKEKKISAVANVPEAASVSANPGHAVVLLFVNQTVVVGTSPPTDTASSVRVTLDKIDDRWLISEFDPV